MRAPPIGVYPSIDEVVEKLTLQARITHDTKDGVRAAVAASLMSHYFLYRIGPKRELGKFLESQVEGRWNTPWKQKVGSKGWMAVQAGVTAVIENKAHEHAAHEMHRLRRGCGHRSGNRVRCGVLL